MADLKLVSHLDKSLVSQEESDEIKALFQKTFDPITATDEYKRQLKDTLKSTTESDRQQKQQFTYKKMWKVATVAACILIFIRCRGATSVKAAISNIYQYFFETVGEKYEQTTEGYSQKLDKQVNLQDKVTLDLKEYLLLNNGINIRYKVTEDSRLNVQDITPNEMKIETKDGVKYHLEQEMVTSLTDGYMASFICKEKDVDFETLLEQEVIATISFVCSADEVTQKEVTIKITPKKVYQAKEYTYQGEGITIGDSGYVVNRIRYDAWYVTIEYSVKKEMDNYPVLEVKTPEQTELLFLGGAFDQEKNKYYQYIQMPEYPIEEFCMRPGIYSEKKKNPVEVVGEKEMTKIKLVERGVTFK